MTTEEKLAEYVLEQLCELVPHDLPQVAYSYSFADSNNYPNISFVCLELESLNGVLFSKEEILMSYKIRTRSDKDPYFNGDTYHVSIKNKELVKKFKLYHSFVKEKCKLITQKAKIQQEQQLINAIKNTISGIVK